MHNLYFRPVVVLLAALLLAACGPSPAANSASGSVSPQAGTPALATLVAPVDLNGDGQIDICEAIPQSVLEQVMGRPLVGVGQPFQDPDLGDGCAFDFGRDGSAAYFVYVTYASTAQFDRALANAVKAEPVTTLGDSAFLNYGSDARQLWVRQGERAALVAIGDRENVAGMMVLAPYLIGLPDRR